MKLASLTNGPDSKHGRDGKLVVVSADLTRAVEAAPIAATLQQALDNWASTGPQLAALAQSLELNAVPSFRFHERDCTAPLPRAYQFVDGSAYVNHVELVRKARGAEMPQSFWHDPLMYQATSDRNLGPREAITLADTAYGLDFEAEIAVVVTDVPLNPTREQAEAAIALVMLVNDTTLRNLIPDELAKGFGFLHAKPASSFSPVAVTPNALGDAWREGKLHLPLLSALNGAPFGKPEAGQEMTFDFPALIQHAAKTRALGAGTIIGSGTVSNRDADGSPGRPIAQGGRGYSCIAELRMVETVQHGTPQTPFLGFGDTIRIEIKDPRGHSIFGAIEQTVAPLTPQP